MSASVLNIRGAHHRVHCIYIPSVFSLGFCFGTAFFSGMLSSLKTVDYFCMSVCFSYGNFVWILNFVVVVIHVGIFWIFLGQLLTDGLFREW